MDAQNISYYFLGTVLTILLAKENVSLLFEEKSFPWQMMNSLRHNLHLKVTTLPSSDKKHEKYTYALAHTYTKKYPFVQKKNKTRHILCGVRRQRAEGIRLMETDYY